MAFSLWLAFFGASVLLAIAPGPDNLFVLMQSAVFGVRAGMIVVLGLATGLLLQTLAAALGIYLNILIALLNCLMLLKVI